MKKIIITVIFITMILTTSFADNDLSADSKKKVKAIEFSIGFSSITSFYYETTFVNDESQLFTYGSSGPMFILGDHFGFGIPISFVYYPNNYVGIGVNNTIKHRKESYK